MKFEVLGRITNVEVIASGAGVRLQRYLRKLYGRGSWRKHETAYQALCPVY